MSINFKFIYKGLICFSNSTYRLYKTNNKDSMLKDAKMRKNLQQTKALQFIENLNDIFDCH